MRKQKDDMQVNVAGLRRNIKNLAHNYSDAQVKVREATSNDPWGPSATIMAEIADLTYNVVAFSEIMQMIWKRLNDHGRNWRHVYKALILLEYLIKTGTEKVAQQCKENIFAIQTLREFIHFEESKDQGTHVREKAKQLVNLLNDAERLKNERIKALKAKERFAQHPSGFGSDGYIDGPLHRDMPPGWQEEPKPVSELEMVRPQTAGEEELQLQLAMAMSREEAEQEEAKRRSDDVRLQLALSQSEQDFNHGTCRDQTGRPYVKKEEPQSHLLDLLDISLSGTSISSPPLGAAGGVGSDPWGAQGRAASQLSDPWSGTVSPPIDPWLSTAMRSTAAPLGAVGGSMTGNTNGESWALRTQSPSVASGSSTEGWLQSNGTINGNANTGAAAVDPWLTKTTIAVQAAAPPPSTHGNQLDSWLSESPKTVDKPLTLEDPWAPKAKSDDPWRTTDIAKKPSPDLDEFDIITNRNKTGDLLTNNSTRGPNNNNTSLLDEMDPLSLSYTSTGNSLTGTTNVKKQLKTPQAFLGENSSLVNLDNLIKPVAPQTAGNAAYNPFSDTIVPPKTNLFQQQQPAVPSINQLKQQQPFAMTMNQDPWAPVANTNATSQTLKDATLRDTFFSFDAEFNSIYSTNNGSSSNNSNNCTSQEQNNSWNSVHYSRSDYDVFNKLNLYQFDNNNHDKNNNNTMNDIYYNDNDKNNATISNYGFNNSNKNYSYSVDNIRNMQISSTGYDTATALINVEEPSSAAHDFASVSMAYHPYTEIPATKSSITITNSKNNNYAYISKSNTVDSMGVASRYSSDLTASLAAMPGIKISKLQPATVLGTYDGSAATGSLFNYGFYDSNFTSNTANCGVENNNNMPWTKPEAAAASNPFLS